MIDPIEPSGPNNIPIKLVTKPHAITCPNCGSTDVVAVYICPSCKTMWKSSGPRDPGTGIPIPEPCPGYTTVGSGCTNPDPVPAVSLICNTCGWVQPLANSDLLA